MDLHHEFTVPLGIDAAWVAFNDLERIGPAFPGAAVTSVDGDDFTGTAKVKLGPISLQYNGTGRFVSRDEAAHRAVIEASGKDRRGNGTASAVITARVEPVDAGTTKVLLDTDLKITGRPAQFGRGVIQDVGGKILDQFAANLGDLLGSPADLAAQQGAATQGTPPASEPSTPDAAVPDAAVTDAAGPADVGQGRVAESAELDLGSVVGPALLQRYGVTLAACAATAVVTWLLIRRRR